MSRTKGKPNGKGKPTPKQVAHKKGDQRTKQQLRRRKRAMRGRKQRLQTS